ncbi:large conductance mechanosensitive channel protein MscL [Hugonella massiliensis]|uniref:large conductance mechanosensitive channel protein MscL n=1 Tax=Hugonella massiliensis TaxID=1720315 RepID=UPI00073F85BD|nr:large conductance mechanosensitive channel protein MscL [Hugonella massiliensis]
MSKSKGFIAEFRTFISRGNVMDMAVGVIIGGAFTAIVTSLTTDIINPLITLISGGNGADMGALNIKVTDTVSMNFGSFIGAVINFLIIALIVFCLVKAFNKVEEAGRKLTGTEEEVPVPAPTCPYCLEEVKAGATRCSHCGGEFAAPAKAGSPAQAK